MMIRPTSRLNANNAASNWMQASNSLVNFSSFDTNPALKLGSEQRLTADMFNNKTLYKAGMLQDEASKKYTDDNIKVTFSTFA